MNYDFIDKDTFIGKYIEYMSGQETPLVYDFMCACWALSIAVGRECYVNRPKAPVRLNMYIILSSDSGVTRKSTSVRVATNIIRDFLTDAESKLILIESKITTGQLQYELYNATKTHGYAHVAISASELAAVLSRSGGLSGLLLSRAVSLPVVISLMEAAEKEVLRGQKKETTVTNGTNSKTSYDPLPEEPTTLEESTLAAVLLRVSSNGIMLDHITKTLTELRLKHVRMHIFFGLLLCLLSIVNVSLLTYMMFNMP